MRSMNDMLNNILTVNERLADDPQEEADREED